MKEIWDEKDNLHKQVVHDDLHRIVVADGRHVHLWVGNPEG